MHPSVVNWVCPAKASAPLCRVQPVWWWLAFLALKGIIQDGILTAAILFIDHRHTTTTRKVLMVSRIIVAICFGFWIYQGVQTTDWNLYVSDPAFGLYHCYNDAWVKRHVRRQSHSKPQSWSLESAQQYLEDFRVRNLHRVRKVEEIMKNREGKHPAELRLELNKLRVEGDEDEIRTLKQAMGDDEGTRSCFLQVTLSSR